MCCGSTATACISGPVSILPWEYPGNNQVREYSIYSTEQDTSLEVLIKEVDNGLVSRQLRKLIPGELLEVDGPFGYFTIG